ncbi:bloodthirsty-related gene family, member 2 [Denticeps clupeoides]|uniref:Uncharacterized protein n=1 Tax=Denticeps clupeoides TaxID=299321 RepID=A0AAY4BQM8_9TELE|nr:E3 ubiquitin-protein ligase TRIM39-like [Denticeps clupeoides]XP_028842466.1 E3 ubiquitin-protein ligase TRIM39-like [Denticeps clupeoides]
MASTINLLSEKHLLCSLCERIFNRPVTTPCGHSFCKTCLRKYWSHSGGERCPLCKRTFAARPHISINRILADVIENYKKTQTAVKQRSSQKTEEKLEKTNEEVEQLIQERLSKVENLKTSLKLLQASCHQEIQESHRVFSTLLSFVEQSHQSVLATVEEKQRQAERRVDKLVRELDREILDLKGNISETKDQQSDQLKRWGSQHSLGPAEMRDWSRVTLEIDPCVGTVRGAVLDLMDKVLVQANQLSKLELKRLQKYSADVTLNHQTAHAHLILSEDKKQVRHGDKKQDVPESPKRFDRVANVLGKESFSTGRHYWEVEVRDKMEWDLGVVRHSVNRKGKFTVCPANGFWTLSLRNGNQYTANTSPPTPLALSCKPKRVAIFVDYEEGRVSFLCVDTGVHIHTFTDTFKDTLHPFFSPGHPHRGKNAAPLTVITNFCSI